MISDIVDSQTNSRPATALSNLALQKNNMSAGDHSSQLRQKLLAEQMQASNTVPKQVEMEADPRA